MTLDVEEDDPVEILERMGVKDAEFIIRGPKKELAKRRLRMMQAISTVTNEVLMMIQSNTTGNRWDETYIEERIDDLEWLIQMLRDLE